MQANLERARAHQPPLKSMGSSVGNRNPRSMGGGLARD